MGLYDRDYMRDESSPRSPRQSPNRANKSLLNQMTSTLLIVGGVVLLIAVAPVLWMGTSSSEKETKKKPTLEDHFLTVQFPVDINTASKKDLMAVPHVGFSIATRIVTARPFETVEDVIRVDGIGETTFGKMKPYIMVGTNTVPQSTIREAPQESPLLPTAE